MAGQTDQRTRVPAVSGGDNAISTDLPAGLTLWLVGIGPGHPDYLTRQAIDALNHADLLLVPRKGAGKEDLAALRHAIIATHIRNPAAVVAEFDLPRRDPAIADYAARVEAWHDAIAAVWAETIARHPQCRNPALMIWGDPSLYDSAIRIAGRLGISLRVVPGITSLQALCAAHAVPLNTIGAPVTITTGRRLARDGWPAGVDTLVVMLDGEQAFASIPPDGVTIWWAAYAGMTEEILDCGPLAEAAPRILRRREAARAHHGWIMDIYLLRKG